ncbi:MAG: transcription termination/antitermination NusG family protein [Ignavibacteriota bacterium]
MHWFALYCRAQHEEIVADGLKLASIEAFYPSYQASRKWTDRTKTSRKPLFPGYCFARFEPRQQAEAAGIRGVVQILSTPYEGPIAIPDGEIEAVRRLVNSGCELHGAAYHEFQLGEKVQVEYGLFVGVSGVVTRIKRGGYRLVVGITAIGMARSVEVDVDSLRPAKSSCAI